MEKRLENFIFLHGRNTYIMAWVVELCLFGLGIALAAFNLIFGLTDPEVDVLSSTILAIGWVIIGIMELATIPLAGSFRLARGKDKLIAVSGLCGLLFLSSYTVYEFNEIASEYLTRGARQTSVAVEKIKKDIDALIEEKTYLEETGLLLEKEKRKLQTDYEQKVAFQNDQFEREKEEIVQYYGGLLNDAARRANFPIYYPDEKAKREHHLKAISQEKERIANLEIDKTQIISDLRNKRMAENRPELEVLEKNITSIKTNIDTIDKEKEQRIEAATRRGFKSREAVIEEIQRDARVSREEEQENLKDLQQRKIELQNFKVSSAEISDLETRIRTSRKNIAESQQRLDEIQKFATERMDSPETKALFAKNEADQNDVYRGRLSALKNLKETHNSTLRTLEDTHNTELKELEESSRSKASRLKTREQIEAEIIKKQTEISDQVEKTARKYERTMYFRMASWFTRGDESVNFGSLPTRDHYNKALLYIFAPIGLFIGILSIVLAYLGTGFMFEESKRRNPEEASLQDQEDLLQEITDLRGRLTTAQINEDKQERTINSLETQVENQAELRRTIEDLKKRLSKNEADLITQKQRVFDAVKSVPQIINIPDESNK